MNRNIVKRYAGTSYQNTNSSLVEKILIKTIPNLLAKVNN